MLRATLQLDNVPALEGSAETGGDYVRLLIDDQNDASQFSGGTDGQIDIDGKSERVTLEGAADGSLAGQDGVVLTLRRHSPVIHVA